MVFYKKTSSWHTWGEILFKIKFLKRTFASCFDRNLGIQVQVFNLLAVVVIIAGLVVSIIAAMIGSGMAIVITNSSISVLSLITLRIAQKKNCHSICIWICVIIAFFIALPLLFFFCGGINSGAGTFFVVGIVFTSALLYGMGRILAIGLELLLYSACFAVAYFWPELLTKLSSEFDYLLHQTLNFLSACVLLLILVMVIVRIFQNRQELIE